jgi:hypothetical protein
VVRRAIVDDENAVAAIGRLENALDGLRGVLAPVDKVKSNCAAAFGSLVAIVI